MRRDYFTLELRDVGTDPVEQPTVHVEYDGPSDELETRLTPGTDLDLAFRFQTPVDDPDADGVLAITERLTGDFVLEVNADADAILDLVDAAKAYGQEGATPPDVTASKSTWSAATATRPTSGRSWSTTTTGTSCGTTR